jgi:hypothetical protein
MMTVTLINIHRLGNDRHMLFHHFGLVVNSHTPYCHGLVVYSHAPHSRGLDNDHHAPNCHGLVDEPYTFNCHGLVNDPHALSSINGMANDSHVSPFLPEGALKILQVCFCLLCCPVVFSGQAKVQYWLNTKSSVYNTDSVSPQI